MYFQLLYRSLGVNRLHSGDLPDMREAILEEDHDGPDGGSPHSAVKATRSHYRERQDHIRVVKSA